MTGTGNAAGFVSDVRATEPSDVEIVDRLRHVAARLVDASPPGDDLAAWFCDVVGRYLHGAPSGLSLEQALGLGLKAGQRPWWVLEQLAERDRRIRELASLHFPGQSARGQALGIRRRRDLMKQLPVRLSEESLRRILRAGASDPPYS